MASCKGVSDWLQAIQGHATATVPKLWLHALHDLLVLIYILLYARPGA